MINLSLADTDTSLEFNTGGNGRGCSASLPTPFRGTTGGRYPQFPCLVPGHCPGFLSSLSRPNALEANHTHLHEMGLSAVLLLSSFVIRALAVISSPPPTVTWVSPKRLVSSDLLSCSLDRRPIRTQHNAARPQWSGRTRTPTDSDCIPST